jgi:hypothetical protein
MKQETRHNEKANDHQPENDGNWTEDKCETCGQQEQP